MRNLVNLDEQIYDLLTRALPKGKFNLTTQDGMHYSLLAQDESFKALSTLEQHKIINNIIRPLIDQGLIHAISIKTSYDSECQ